jgi:glycosyltransferase involved in cell wall biosynthesis
MPDRSKPKLVVLITHPIQYYAPLYRELASRGGIDLHVVFLSDSGSVAYHDRGFGQSLSWDIPLLDGYEFTVLEPGLVLENRGFWNRYSRKLLGVLDMLDPDAILLHGYASRMNWFALRWARRKMRSVIYTSDSNSKTKRSRFKVLVKRLFVSNFFRNVSYFLSTSEANAEYLRQFGAREFDIFRTPFAIEYSRWASGSVGEVKKYQFAWAGKFVARKRPLDFVHALKIIATQVDGEVSGILIGDGPMRSEIEAALNDLPMSLSVELTGFVNQKDMPATLRQADTFVFTSESEPYGLIATEAAAAGLALIVAEGIGCIGETVLARPHVNALTYPPGDVEALASAMLRVLSDDETRARMQKESQAIAQQHDIPVAASIIEDLLLNIGSNAVVGVRSTATPVAMRSA